MHSTTQVGISGEPAFDDNAMERSESMAAVVNRIFSEGLVLEECGGVLLFVNVLGPSSTV
jgi:hypothetical protein